MKVTKLSIHHKEARKDVTSLDQVRISSSGK